jgi:hypothetical protein
MFALPEAALPLLRSVAGACVWPTAQRFLNLMVGAILTAPRIGQAARGAPLAVGAGVYSTACSVENLFGVGDVVYV